MEVKSAVLIKDLVHFGSLEPAITFRERGPNEDHITSEYVNCTIRLKLDDPDI